jgi:hypothetical protein
LGGQIGSTILIRRIRSVIANHTKVVFTVSMLHWIASLLLKASAGFMQEVARIDEINIALRMMWLTGIEI